MSLTTRCPACETVFKVVPDQLRIASGWVRCGQCGTVFDGRAQLLAPDPEAGAPPVDAAERADADAGSEAQPPAQSSPALAQPDDTGSGAPVPAEVPAQPAAQDAIPISRRFAQLEHDLLVNPPTPLLRSDDEPSLDADLPEGASAPAAEPHWREPQTPTDSAPDDDAAEAATPASAAPDAPVDPAPAEALEGASEPPSLPSFVAQSQRRARWQSGPMRVALWAASLVLALALAGQWALQQRDWLAARQPSLLPLLQALCQPLQCRVAPYRRLEAIVIDGSGFNRIDAEHFRFTVTLHNKADLPVATPALELALTDVAGQVLLRRVLQPDEFGAPPALAAGGEFDGTRVLTVAAEAQPQAIVNYRVTAFYP